MYLDAESGHNTFTGNTISNNEFFYRIYRGKLPSIWLGARDGNRSYCSLDAGYNFGSGQSDKDFANGNVIENNKIRCLSPSKMIHDNGENNRISNNKTV
ncbi:hypothetical protein QEO94_10515 [Kingella negevensis]|uniref:hypothetical protein n=1 Tax=Kingella negevensis TaxID=1522312 RepID=UPI0025431F5D|nr:hypothetical protein [Kingella negevensis]WII93042.1 hypothetical protein QEO94_10515 [Kingella negevensis]